MPKIENNDFNLKISDDKKNQSKNGRIDKFISNPKKALFTIAFPIILGMLVQALYNVVDTAFVGRLGSDAIAGLTFSFPLFILLLALNAGVGTGMSSKISRYLGAKRHKDAENAAIHGLLLSIFLGLIVFIIGKCTLVTLLTIFGAEGQVLTYAIDYMEIILLSVFFMFPAFIIHNIFVSTGDSRTPVIMMASALIINIILDPIFIFVLDLGVKGAAIATLITFVCALIFGIILLRIKSDLHIHKKNFHFSKKLIISIFKVGAPASVMMILMSTYVIFINKFMAHFSTHHVAAFGIASKLETFVAMPIMGFSLALLTLTGMFYGAKRYDLLKSIVKYGITITTIIVSFIGLIFFSIPEIFMKIFTTDPEIIKIGAQYLKIDVLTFPLMAIGMSISRVMQGMGHGLPGLVINLTRILIVAVPLAWLFIYIMGYGFLSIAVAMVIGGFVAVIIALSWISIKFKNLQ